MAQTTTALSFSDCYFGYSTDGAAWTEISGSTNEVLVTGGDRQSGEAYTADGLYAIVTYGKYTPFEITFNGVYSSTASELYDAAQTAYAAGTAFYFRWSPAGGGSGDLGYTSSVGRVASHPYPQGSAADGAPAMISITLKCGQITESTIGTAGW